MTRPYNQDGLNLTHAQRTRIAAGTGMFKRQYVSVLTNRIAVTPKDAWEGMKRDLRVLHVEESITDGQRALVKYHGRDVFDEMTMQIARELDRYDLLDERLGELARVKKP